MIIALAILTLLSSFSFLYFLVVAALAIVGARLEMKRLPSPQSSLLRDSEDGGPYTERGKELMGATIAPSFSSSPPALSWWHRVPAMFICETAQSDHLRSSLRSSSRHRRCFWQRADSLSRLRRVVARMLGRRCPAKAARRVDERRSTPADHQEFAMDGRLLRHCSGVIGGHATPIRPTKSNRQVSISRRSNDSLGSLGPKRLNQFRRRMRAQARVVGLLPGQSSTWSATRDPAGQQSSF